MLSNRSRESSLERHFCRLVEAAGGRAWKWSSPGRRGVPDRIVTMPGGVVAFVELKSPRAGAKPSRLQLRAGRELARYGCRFAVVGSIDDAQALVDALRGAA